MASRFAIEYHLMAEFFQEEMKLLSEGEKAYTAGHVKEFRFSSEIQPAHMYGTVQPRMKTSKQYDVEISFHLKEGVKEAHCSCPRGQVRCHHMGALLWYARYNVSVTDVEKRWGVPKQSDAEELVVPMQQLCSKEQFVVSDENISELAMERFKTRMGITNVVGFSWWLRPEPSEDFQNVVQSIEDLIFSAEFCTSKNQRKLFLDKMKLTKEEIKQIADATVGQHKNEKWLIARKHRLTSSKFGAIISACARNKYPKSFYKNLLEGYDLDRALAVQWGKNNEETAKRKFEEVFGVKVEDTGLWLHECGYLGASPDGLVNQTATLEIKCPYKYRNTPLKEGVKDKKYFFWYNEADEVVIKMDHMYYHQIQGQLYFTGREICYFFIWTPNEYEMIPIAKDPNWISHLDVVKEFYIQKFLPCLLDL